jgi:hypothetical protein
MMACQADVVKHMLHRPILSRRIGEWAYTLIHCGLALEPLSTLKSQILVNLFAEHGIDSGDKINYCLLPMEI